MLKAPKAFFDSVRSSRLLGSDLSSSEVNGINAILEACDRQPIAYTAYMLATAYHETAHTMLPIKEHGGDAYFARMYDINGNRPAVAKTLGNTNPGDGAKFAGRGYVQLTGRSNYARAGKELFKLGQVGSEIALLLSPDLAMNPAIAADIMVLGMTEGWFTGLTLANSLPKGPHATTGQFRSARRIINGLDRADDIASYAMSFQTALAAGGWQ